MVKTSFLSHQNIFTSKPNMASPPLQPIFERELIGAKRNIPCYVSLSMDRWSDPPLEMGRFGKETNKSVACACACPRLSALRAKIRLHKITHHHHITIYPTSYRIQSKNQAVFCSLLCLVPMESRSMVAPPNWMLKHLFCGLVFCVTSSHNSQEPRRHVLLPSHNISILKFD